MMVLAQVAKDCSLISGMTIDDSSHLARAIYATLQETQVNAVNLARMLPCIPTNSQSALVDTGLPNPNDAATTILKAFLFQVSNKLYAHSREQERKGLLSLFQELDETNSAVLSYLTNSKDPTSEAIIESLYEAAIEQGATALATRLLEGGRDANALLSVLVGSCHSVDRGRASFYFSEVLQPSTALQYAAATCNIQLAYILIQSGVKADLGQPTPLQILCTSSKSGHEDTLQFADLLVSHGALVNRDSNSWLSPLEGAVLSGNRILVCFLLQHGATDALRWSSHGLSRLSHNFLRKEAPLPLLLGDQAPISALQLVILTKDESIAQVLLSSIQVQEGAGYELLRQAFITACVAGDQYFVRVILKRLGYQLAENEELIDSAFLGAAWDMDCRIAQLLVEHHAIRRRLQESCLSIFQAAALHGNTNLIMMLHSSGFDINHGPSLKLRSLLDEYGRVISPPAILSTPLGCAVWMGHSDAIETLLNLEADIASVDLIAAIQTRSLELITQVLYRCDNVHELGVGKSALDVAVRCGIGLKLICKLVDVGAVIKGHELVDAVRSNDQEVVRFLLPACDILAINPSGETVLEVACYIGNLEIALRYFACGGVYGSRALVVAVSRAVKLHDYRFIEHVVANRPPGPIDEYEARALALSIQTNDTALVDILLHDDFKSSNALSTYGIYLTRYYGPVRRAELGIRLPDFQNLSLAIEDVVPEPDYADPDIDDYRLSPLLVAAASAQEGTVRRMLEHGYLLDPDLLYRIHERELSFFDDKIRDTIMSAYVLQLSNVADRDWHQSMLLTALERGLDREIIQQHFSKLPSLDFQVEDLGFPLENAVLSESYDHVRAVLEAGATADARKWPPANRAFREALMCESLGIVSLLLDYGAHINHDPHEYFQLALIKGDFRMPIFLLDHGLNINNPLTGQPDLPVDTCLEYAASEGMIDTVELLFSRGVSIQGRARIHFIRSVVMATNRCHYATAKLLKDRGCWNDEDNELAKTDRGSDTRHKCPRFLYDDLTLEGCRHCKSEADTSCTSDFSKEEDMLASPHSYEGADVQFTSDEMDLPTDDMSVLDKKLGTMDYEPTMEMHEWPFVSYGRQDMELDTIVKGLLLEDGTIS